MKLSFGVKRKYLKYEVAFGKNVKRLREEKGLTQLELASIAEILPNQVYRVENAKHGATLSTIVALAVALGKTPEELHQDVEYKLELNTNFTPTSKKPTKNAEFMDKLLKTEFLDTYREVKEVIIEVEKLFGVRLTSSATSGVLTKFMKDGILERKLSRNIYEYRRINS